MKCVALCVVAAAGLAAQVRVAPGTATANPLPQTPLPPGIYQIGNLVSAPVVKFHPGAEYSEEAMESGVMGSVMLQLVVVADGVPADITVQRRLGFGLDEQAVKNVQQWRFAPGRRYAEPVAVRANIEVNFRSPDAITDEMDAARADFVSGVRILEGLGVKQDVVRGLQLIAGSADAGFGAAQYRMGLFHEYGGHGIILNNQLAEDLYRKCAINGKRMGVTVGLSRCQLGLGRLLVSDSLKRVEGMAWLELAADGGSAEAKELLVSELRFTPEDQQAQAREMKKILLPN